jgi:hypothetical protein
VTCQVTFQSGGRNNSARRPPRRQSGEAIDRQLLRIQLYEFAAIAHSPLHDFARGLEFALECQFHAHYTREERTADHHPHATPPPPPSTSAIIASYSFRTPTMASPDNTPPNNSPLPSSFDENAYVSIGIHLHHMPLDTKLRL